MMLVAGENCQWKNRRECKKQWDLYITLPYNYTIHTSNIVGIKT